MFSALSHVTAPRQKRWGDGVAMEAEGPSQDESSG